MAPPRYKGDCCRSCLRGCLRALNYLLAIIGVLMVAYALFMYVQWSEQSPEPPSPSPAPHKHHHHHDGPAPAPKALVQHTWDDNTEDDGFATLSSLRLASETLAGEGDEPSGTGVLASKPWFIYVFGGAGLFVFVTASVGILSADCAGCGVTCFLGLYHALMVLLLLIQISVVCFYFFDKSWEKDLPKDTTGEYEKMRQLVLDNLRACQLIGVSTLGLQLLALLVSCSLYYAESRPRLEYRTLQQHDYESASQRSVPVAHPAAGPSGGGNGGREAWRGRVADKYAHGSGGGGGDGYGGYDPERGRPDEDYDEGRGPKRCSIM